MSGINALGSGAGTVKEIIALRQQLIERSQLLQQLHAPQEVQSTETAADPAGNFAGVLKSALDGVNATQAKAQDLGEAYQRGEVTDVAKVMLARQEAGIAFEATLQVRNKLLAAYQDIMRMGV